MKRNINYNSDSAWVEKIDIDLADKGMLQKYITSQSIAPFSKVTVTIVTRGAVGTSGTVTLAQCAFASGKPATALTGGGSIVLGANINLFATDVVDQEFLVLDLSSVTLGNEGTMTIIMHCKR